MLISVGAAHTFSPIDVWDVELHANKQVSFSVPAGRSLALVVLSGTIEVNGEHIARESQLVVFEQDGSDFSIETASESKVMILSGEPLNEPIEGYGPFVMNTAQEIREAISDFNSGRFGSMERSN